MRRDTCEVFCYIISVMKRIFLSASVLSLLVLLLAACGAPQSEVPPELTIAELLDSPQNYNNEIVVVQGFYFHGFETAVMCESLVLSGIAEGHLVPDGEMLWVEGGLPRAIYDALYVQSQMGPDERYGKIEVKCRFETGGKFGHLGTYDSQITPVEVKLLPWSPPGQN